MNTLDLLREACVGGMVSPSRLRQWVARGSGLEAGINVFLGGGDQQGVSISVDTVCALCTAMITDELRRCIMYA